MPSLASLEVEGYGVSAVATVESLFTSFLERASEIKPTNSIEPALKKSDFDDLPGEVSRQFSALGAKDADGKKGRQYAIVETAVRNMFGSIVVSPTGVYDPFRSGNLMAAAQGEHRDRLARLCSCLEFARHPVHPRRQRGMRSVALILAG